MAQRARHFAALLLLLSTGCVTVSSPWSFPNSVFRRDKSPAKNERTSTPSEEDEEEREPLIAGNTEAEEKTGPEALKHDPATRMLIDAELRDATPEQRAEWIAYLATVETSEVPELLKERRMAIRREPVQIAETETTETPLESEVIPAAHSMSPSGTNLPRDDAEGVVAATANTAEATGESHNSAPLVGVASGAAWQKKFKSITDPNWLWSHPSNEPGEEHAPAARGERGYFGLPQVRPSRSEPLANSHETTAAAVVPLNPAPLNPTPLTASIEPTITPGSALWEDEVVKLISLLEAEVSSLPGQGSMANRQDTRKQVALRMLYLVANEPQKALQVIPGLPPEEQEFWATLFMGLSEHLDQTGANDPAERATQTIAQLRTAAYHLQQTANLRIRNAVFCEQINGFGNYDLFETDQFSPGQTVLIYAEIRNFKSTPTEGGHFLTRIRSTIEIYNTGNGQQLVDRSTFDPTEDRSRTLRTDYYHSYRLDLPANLSSGPHVVKLILQDELSGKQTTESIKFIVK